MSNRLKNSIKSEIDIHFVKSEAEEIMKKLNFSLQTIVKVCTIVSELAHNQLKYAKSGWIEISIAEEGEQF